METEKGAPNAWGKRDASDSYCATVHSWIRLCPPPPQPPPPQPPPSPLPSTYVKPLLDLDSSDGNSVGVLR